MKNAIIAYCDRIIQFCLYCALFTLAFTKAALEVFVWIAVAAWLLKRALMLSRPEGLSGRASPAAINRLILFFLAANIIAVILSVDRGLSFRAFCGKILKFVIMYYMVAETITTKKRLRNVLVVCGFSMLLIIADAAAQYFTGHDFLRGFPFERLRASFTSANAFGGWLLVYLPLLWAVAAAHRNKGAKSAVYAACILLVACLVMTASRGAWVGFVISAGFLAYQAVVILRYNVKKTIIAGVLFVAAIALFLPYSDQKLPYSTRERMQTIGDVDANLNRFILWSEALAIMEDFPVFGSGLNTYTVAVRHYALTEGSGTYPHNSFLQMAAETGLIGVVAFIALVAGVFQIGLQAFRARKDQLLLGLVAGGLGFLVQSFFDTNLFSLQLVVLFWFMLGLTVAVARLNEAS
jgi:putative inorganic carbon (hco3(-)) transporter